MSSQVQPGERPDAPSSIAVMVVLSLFVHVALVLAVVFFAIPALGAPPDRPMTISLMHPPIDFSGLPVIDGSRDAGPLRSVPQQLVQAPAVEEKKAEERPKEEREPEPKEEKKAEAKKEEPKPEPVKKAEEAKPKPQEREAEVISAKNITTAEKEPEQKPAAETAEELRTRLESSQGVYSEHSKMGGSDVSHHVALDNTGDPGGGGGAPDIFRNRLVALIGQTWEPPRARPGQVMEAVIEFTIVSQPVDASAVNVNRERARVVGIVLVKSSGEASFDAAAEETIRRLRNLPPLPDYVKGSSLKVSCRFYFIGE
jgi:outer membrane biosynthesis protein TonB